MLCVEKRHSLDTIKDSPQVGRLRIGKIGRLRSLENLVEQTYLSSTVTIRNGQNGDKTPEKPILSPESSRVRKGSLPPGYTESPPEFIIPSRIIPHKNPRKTADAELMSNHCKAITRDYRGQEARYWNDVLNSSVGNE